VTEQTQPVPALTNRRAKHHELWNEGHVLPHSPPPEAIPVSLMGVGYLHIKTRDGGDLYLTAFGAPFWEHLLPENWYAKEWFETKRRRLLGTSTVYTVPTRQLRDTSLPLVVKWSRVGEEVPLETLTINKFIHAEFNSPFEEFALLMELRAGAYGPPGFRIHTQKPLAIYVPSERLLLWQTGRSESKIAAKLARHPTVELDMLRQYVLLYGWVKGLDLVEIADLWQMKGAERNDFLAHATDMVMHELDQKGYRVIDMKPAHVIVRPKPNRTLLRDRHGQIGYAVVDYELLERTPVHAQVVRRVNRQHYLQHVAHRFQVPSGNPTPPHLQASQLMGVDYIFGHAESTGGLLWVVGKDPDLFNYFLPERWRRTPKTSLSATGEVYWTCTKDNVNLVWRVNRMGEVPVLPGDPEQSQKRSEYGFNSPFEEFAFAFELKKAGIKTVYPRAVYMTGHKFPRTQKTEDTRRYKILEHLRTPDGQPAVCKRHDYIAIWGFWNGPDEVLAVRDGHYYRSYNLRQAVVNGYLTEPGMAQLINETAQRLNQTGFEHLDLRPEHLLLSFTPEGKMVLANNGGPEVRLCNLELLRPLESVRARLFPPKKAPAARGNIPSS
jgi:hypothetical protein